MKSFYLNMKKYRVTFELNEPNEDGNFFSEFILLSSKSPGHLSDYLLTNDRDGKIRSVEVVPA